MKITDLKSNSKLEDVLKVLNLPKNILICFDYMYGFYPSKIFFGTTLNITNVNKIIHLNEAERKGKKSKENLMLVIDDIGIYKIFIMNKFVKCFLIEFDSLGYISRIHYYNSNGNFHNINGPAVISYKDGIKLSEVYYLNGKKHNSIGPADRFHFVTNKYWTNDYFFNGKRITKEYFINNLEKRLGL
jgi:hypothetical protein